MPPGWVAVGDPARILPPDRHDDIWTVQSRLDFPGTVYGVARGTPATERMSRQAAWYAAHLHRGLGADAQLDLLAGAPVVRLLDLELA